MTDEIQDNGSVEEMGPDSSGPISEAGPPEPTSERETPEAGTSEAGTPAASTAAAAESADARRALAAEEPHRDTALAAERLEDLQRLQAEYVNYKRRVDRDRASVQERAVHSVIEALLPVLDDIHAARQHGDLESGPFAAIAEKLEQTLARFGVERFGEPGEAFDPMRHEALMHTEAELAEGTEVTTVVQVLQPGYRAGEQVIRPARVAVADPQ